MSTGVMGIFGPWLLWLFGVGTVLLVSGLVAMQLAAAADFPVVRGLGRGAINVGWRMMLAAAAIYVLVLVLEGFFQSMISNLPGT
jgi:hypothetical protein